MSIRQTKPTQCVILTTTVRDAILQVQGRRAQSVGEDFPLRVKVGEGCSLLDVRHHGRIAHTKTSINSTATAPIGQHREEGILVDGVLPFV